MYTVFGKEISVTNANTVNLITRHAIATSRNEFNLNPTSNVLDHFALDNIITRLNKINRGLEYFKSCAVLGCNETNGIEVHHINRLHRKVEHDGKISVLDLKGKRVTGLPAILTITQRKQIPLCKVHHLEFEKGYLSSLNPSKLDNMHSSSSKKFMIKISGNQKSEFFLSKEHKEN